MSLYSRSFVEVVTIPLGRLTDGQRSAIEAADRFPDYALICFVDDDALVVRAVADPDEESE